MEKPSIIFKVFFSYKTQLSSDRLHRRYTTAPPSVRMQDFQRARGILSNLTCSPSTGLTSPDVPTRPSIVAMGGSTKNSMAHDSINGVDSMKRVVSCVGTGNRNARVPSPDHSKLGSEAELRYTI